MQGSQQHNSHASLKSESVWFKTKLVSHFLTLSFLLSQPFYLPYLHAAPIGGEVVGGSGSISQSDLTTTINQSTQNLAIDWQSFDVNTGEIVNFVQPDSSSIALNRILGNNGSTIQGQINANGQVILVNPNGILFTSTATINVGGLVASSLDMLPSDFMNGNYIFNEVLGTDGAVVNSGIINASLGGSASDEEPAGGGNVALIGKKVKNEGVISAVLGSVVLAAGKQSILTFDNQGLLGVQVTKEVLQEDLGLEQAIINNGDINAAGGRVLLTASTSQDIFSQAVNTNNFDQASSVVVHSDGSFTLGGGADVLNTGSIDVSSETNSQNTARIILLGENITSSGSIKADTQNGNAGEIEIHANNKTLLTENSITSAQAFSSGQGGLINVLGNKVGLFDAAQVNASGANGGGEVLIGGDRQGLNTSIRNADFIYLGAVTVVKADATDSGNGGKIITFAKDTARIHGDLFARGGLASGNGGFIETSGLRGFEISNAPDVSALNGNGGVWLIDPFNIEIVDAGTTSSITPFPSGNPDTFTSNANSAVINVGLIEGALLNGDVDIVTGAGSTGTPPQTGNISFNADLAFDGAGSDNTLTLTALNDITFTNTSSITRATGSGDSLDLVLDAGGDINISTDSTGINLFNGKFDIDNNGTGSVTFNSGSINTGGDDITIKDSTAVAFNGATITTASGAFEITKTGNVTSTGTNSITTSGGNFIVKEATGFDSSNVSINVGSGDIDLDGGAGDSGVTGNVVLGSLTANGAFTSDLTITKATSIKQSASSIISIARNTDLDVTSGTGTHDITLENDNDFANIKLQGTDASVVDINGIRITGGTNITNLLKIKTTGNISDGGDVTAATAMLDARIDATTFGNITLNNNNDFNNVKIINANNVRIDDVSGGIAIEANDGPNSGGVRGTLTINSEGSGDIIDLDGIAIPNSSPAATFTGEINVGGAATFNVSNNSSNSIILNTSNNTFGSTVNFGTVGGGSNRIDNISITDDTALTLPVIDIDGSLIASGDSISFRHTHVNNADAGGILSATTTNAFGLGAITQDSTDITARNGAATTLNATGDITLTDTSNSFNDVTILNGRNVLLDDTNTMTLLSSNTSGNLRINTDNELTIAGNISTNSSASAAETGFVWFTGTGNTVLGDNVTIDTRHSSGLNTIDDGYILFDNTVNNRVGDPQYDLTILSDTGNVTFADSVGNADEINRLVITSSNALTSPAIISLQNVTTTGATTTDNIDITGKTIQLNGSLSTVSGTSDGGGIKLTGDVSLMDNITIETNDSTTDGIVTIDGTVNSATTARKLTILSDTGSVDLQQALIGGTNALSALEINSGMGNGTVNLGVVNTTGGNDVIRIDGTTITLNGNINSNNGGPGGGDIRFDGDLLINDTVSINSSGSGNGDVTVNGNITGNNAVNTDTLTITAGTRAVNLNGDVGGASGDAIEGLTISSGSSSIRNINTGSGGVSINTGTLTINGTAGENNIDTTDNSTAAGGIVSLTQNTLNLQANVTINTNTVSGGGDITIRDPAPSATINANGNSLTLDAGNGSVNINTQITNLGGFTVINSLNSTLRGIETNTTNSQITVNAFNNILLDGNYDSGSANMVFNADTSTTDSNDGGLTLGTGSDFSGQNISFSGFNLSADPDSVSAVDTITFNSTSSLLYVGAPDPNAVPGFELSNTFLNSVSAPTIQLSSSNSSVVFDNANLTAITSQLDVNAPTIYFSNVDSQFNNINATATNTIHLNRNFTAINNITLDSPTINSNDLVINTNGSTTVTSTSGFINVIDSVSGTAEIIGPDNFNLNANTINHGDILASRNINIVSGGAYTQTGNIESTNGNISITATTGNIGLANNITNTGSVTVNAMDGSIYDNNLGAFNIDTAGDIFLTATNGIGVGDPLEINSRGSNVSLSATNTVSGNIELTNSGTIRLENIINTIAGSNFNFINTGGDVTLNNVMLDTSSSSSQAYFDITNGNVLGEYQRDNNGVIIPRATAHLTVNTVTFFMNESGSVGQFDAPLITNVPDFITVLAENAPVYIKFFGSTFPTLNRNNAYRNRALQVVESLSGKQLIEIESLAEIDPAIFTDVRNYNHSDIALMMPSDQRYTDNDEEEDEEEKQKREKFLNTVH